MKHTDERIEVEEAIAVLLDTTYHLRYQDLREIGFKSTEADAIEKIALIFGGLKVTSGTVTKVSPTTDNT